MNTNVSMIARNEENPAHSEATHEVVLQTPNVINIGPAPKPVFPPAPEPTALVDSAPHSPVATTAAEEKAHERPHHPTSPSQLQNLEACPCYAGRGGSSDAADRGTKQHAATETESDDGTMEDHEAMAVATCLDFFEREKTLLLEARERAIKGGLPDPGEVYELREVYLPVDNRVLTNYQVDPKTGKIEAQETDCTTGGFIDAVLVAGDFALAMDWKFGMWPVERADNNLQAIAYVLGLFKMFPKVQRIRSVFLQPHIAYQTEFTFTREMIPVLYLRVSAVVERAVASRRDGGFERATPTVPVCNFCGRLGYCTKVADMALNVAEKFFPGEIPDNITPSALHSSKDTAACLRLCQIVSTWAKAFKSITNDRAVRGEIEMPSGYQLQTRQEKELADSGIFKNVVQQFITSQEMESIAEYGLGKIEKVISDKALRGTKTAELEKFKTRLLTSGAMKLGPAISFLKAVAVKKES